MQVTESQARSLLVDVGFPMAQDDEKWDLKRLKKAIKNLPASVDEDKVPTEGDSKDLYDSICHAIDEGEEVTVTADEEAPAPPAKKKGKGTKVKEAPPVEEKEEKPVSKAKGRPKKEAPPVEEKEEEEEATPTKNGRMKKGNGIIDTIAGMLTKASEKNPVTKDEMLDALIPEFPDHPKSSLLATITSQISKLKKERGFTIARIDKGYWAVK